MVDVLTVVIAVLGLLGTAVVFVVTYRDARRVGVSRPRLWATFTAGTLGFGLALYLSPLDVPLTGVLLTANTGPVLYAFEREVTTEDPADSVSVPSAAASDESADESRDSRQSTDEDIRQ